jgi:hypothetical protein
LNIAVPYAASVDHNPLEVAKPLLLLGWSAPAALAARVALERSLRELAAKHGIEVDGKMRSAGPILVALERSRHITSGRGYGDLMQTTCRLNRVAHGGPVSMFVAVKLIEAVERHLGELRQL